MDPDPPLEICSGCVSQPDMLRSAISRQKGRELPVPGCLEGSVHVCCRVAEFSAGGAAVLVVVAVVVVVRDAGLKFSTDPDEKN